MSGVPERPAWWRRAAYEVLTQVIVLLGALRYRIMKWQRWRVLDERIFDLYSDETWACCDCGLQHDARYFGPDEDCGHEPQYAGFQIVGHCRPMRPVGYGYRLRLAADAPDLAQERTSPSTGKATK